jgi:hypothetical protein
VILLLAALSAEARSPLPESMSTVQVPEAPMMLPTPYTAEQIRQAFAPGKQLMFGMETPEGKPVQHWRVLEADETTVTIEYRTQGQEQAATQTHTWVELQQHASFDAAETTRVEETRTEALGTFDCWIYTRSREGEVTTFVFAKELPGPPLKMTTVVGDQPVFSMEQLKRSPTGNEAALLAR